MLLNVPKFAWFASILLLAPQSATTYLVVTFSLLLAFRNSHRVRRNKIKSTTSPLHCYRFGFEIFSALLLWVAWEKARMKQPVWIPVKMWPINNPSTLVQGLSSWAYVPSLLAYSGKEDLYLCQWHLAPKWRTLGFKLNTPWFSRNSLISNCSAKSDGCPLFYLINCKTNILLMVDTGHLKGV